MTEVTSDAIQTLGTLVAASTFLTGFQSVRLSSEFTRLTARADELETRLEDLALNSVPLTGNDVSRVRSALVQLSRELQQGAVSSVIRLLNIVVGTSVLTIAILVFVESHLSLAGNTLPYSVMLIALAFIEMLVLIVSEIDRRKYRKDVEDLTRPTASATEVDAGASRLLLVVTQAVKAAYGEGAPANARDSAIEQLRRRYSTWASPHLWAAERYRRFGIQGDSASVREIFEKYAEYADRNSDDEFLAWWRGAVSCLGELWTRPWALYPDESQERSSGLPKAVEAFMSGTLKDSYGEILDANGMAMLCLRLPELAIVYSPANSGVGEKNVRDIDFLYAVNKTHAICRVTLAHLLQSLSEEGENEEGAQENLDWALTLISPLLEPDIVDAYVLSVASCVMYQCREYTRALQLADECREAPPLRSNIIGVNYTTCHEEAALVAVSAQLKMGGTVTAERLGSSAQRDPRWFSRQTENDEEISELMQRRFPLLTAERILTESPNPDIDGLATFCFHEALMLHIERVPERFWRWTPLVNTPTRFPADSVKYATARDLDELLRSEL